MKKVMFIAAVALSFALLFEFLYASAGIGARWLTEPILEYREINFCMEHDAFYICGGRRIDEKTGALLSEYCAHGKMWGYFLFDEDSGLYGFYGGDESGGTLTLYTWQEFIAEFPYLKNADIIRYGKVDASGFLRSKNVLALQMGGFWGIIDMQGNEILPFIYEHIVIISDTTAFVKVSGLYGIMEFSR